MHWHGNENTRSLPWKEEKDPYKIWLSEVILQQTRAAQGLPYYLRFTERYPTVKDLAEANEEEAFRIWQGLGYYNRCKNMLATARIIAHELDGQFPDTYEGLLALKGIGPYTAAAIGSFAFGLPEAVVDGNVYRVLARYLGIDTPFDTTEGKKQFSQMAKEVLDADNSAAYNQAIMDLGATVCTPQNPKCPDCPLQKHCVAYKQGLTQLLPVRSKKTSISHRYFHYILFTTGNMLWLHKRTAKDIWQSLHEPYLVEGTQAMTGKELVRHPQFESLNIENAALEYEGKLSQRLTHRIIESYFFTCELPTEIAIENGGIWVDYNDLKNLAFPKTVVSFLEKKLYF
ncbi:MAG: A/G-specific adenine glycosylase [Sphingobacteriales bacterium]|nr:MAG: A/G-specific adenine glycosylase [Sphingobacteriales bacterium]